MEIFLSWSGERSKALAVELKRWIQLVIQAAEPWISEDIQKGMRWGGEVQTRLESCQMGIVCVTPENQHAPWLLFEAGVLARNKETNVCTVLLGIKKTDVLEPMGWFQHTETSREDIYKLMETINSRLIATEGKALKDGQLQDAFDTYWPRLEAIIMKLAQEAPTVAVPQRDTADMTREILEIVRDISHAFASFRSSAPSADLITAAKGSGTLRDLLSFPRGALEEELATNRLSGLFALGSFVKRMEEEAHNKPSHGTGSIAQPDGDL